MQLGETVPLAEGAEVSEKDSRIKEYASDRNRADKDTSSRLRCASICAYGWKRSLMVFRKSLSCIRGNFCPNMRPRNRQASQSQRC